LLRLTKSQQTQEYVPHSFKDEKHELTNGIGWKSCGKQTK